MKPSTGDYFVGLDHLRALAAFLVFTWHFNHVDDGQLDGPLLFPLSLLTEGHVGVALFMCLSGYLFAKLLKGKKIRYLPFLWNRVIRLFPLLFVVFFFKGAVGWLVGEISIVPYLKELLWGFVLPVWPNGGWSIAAELHFYVMLPVLLLLAARGRFLLLLVVAASILFRLSVWQSVGDVQLLAYATIVGCIDYFVLGILAHELRRFAAHRHFFAGMVALLVGAFVFAFDRAGGFWGTGAGSATGWIWIVYPTILGTLISYVIAWYDNSFKFKSTGISGFIAGIGVCSYSIYLLHFFVVFGISEGINTHLVSLENNYVTLVFSLITFIAFLPFAKFSFRLIEMSAVKYRVDYIIRDAPTKSGFD